MLLTIFIMFRHMHNPLLFYFNNLMVKEVNKMNRTIYLCNCYNDCGCVTTRTPQPTPQNNNFFAAALNSTATPALGASGNVIFNQVVYPNDNNLVLNADGTITINVPGRYLIYYLAAFDDAATEVSLALKANQNIIQQSNTNSATTSKTITGNTTIDVRTVPTTISLSNNNATSINYIANATSANIFIANIQ